VARGVGVGAGVAVGRGEGTPLEEAAYDGANAPDPPSVSFNRKLAKSCEEEKVTIE